MGIIVSKENRNRTKKVQQTAAVMTALKLASKESKESTEKDSPTTGQAQAGQTSQILQETKNHKATDEHLDFDREHTANLNNDKSSITYGLPELDAADHLAYSSGTTGYWDKSNKVVIGIPYFGAWKHRVCSSQIARERRGRGQGRDPSTLCVCCRVRILSANRKENSL